MSKMMTWMGFMGGIMLLFYFFGILSGTISSTLLDAVLNPQNLESSPLYLQVISVSTLVFAAVSALFARSEKSEFFYIFPIVTILFTFGWDFLVVYQTLAAVSEIGGVIAILFFGPIMLMYVISVVEWWRGVAP